MRHPIEIATLVQNYIWLVTLYITQIKMNTEGVYLKVGNPSNKKAVIVNITNHFKADNNWLQNRLLALRLAIIINKNIRK